jgi:hypothetical protein
MYTRALQDRLNQTFDSLATGLKPTQPTTTATILSGTQTLRTPQTSVAFVSQQPAQQQYNPWQLAQQQYNPWQLAQQQYNVQQPATQQQYYPQTPAAFVSPDLEGGTVLYKKEAAIVAKMYTDSQKYNRVSKSFDFKLAIFEDICRRAGLQPDNYMIAFSTMLKGLVQDHYYNCSLSAKTYTEACTHIQNFFKGPEFYRKNLAEWNTITLQSIIDMNIDKPVYQCLQLLIDKLCRQQHGINSEFQTSLFLTNKLVMACQGVPACRIAVSNLGEDLSQLINKLQSSIVT